MLKQLEIFYNLVPEFKEDSSIDGVLLNGSVAVGTATELSDLDIIVLCQRDAFVSRVIDGVSVEIHYITFNNALEKLKNNPMEVYKYLDAKIEYDNGKLQEILFYAESIYENYYISEKKRQEITYWLKSTKLKLESAFLNKDIILISYLTATNTWMVLEGIWAVNQKPVPPSGSLYRRYSQLEIIPFENWFEGLLTGDTESKGRIMIECIDWILKKLGK